MVPAFDGALFNQEWKDAPWARFYTGAPLRRRLDEDTLALFDLLLKPDLDKGDIKRLKAVAVGLYDVLKAQMDAMQDFVAKQATRDRVRVAINDFLYDDQTGLPESYLPEEVDEKAQAVFAHLLMQRRPDFHV